MLSDLPIPLASDIDINRVAQLVEATVLQREEYAKSIRLARDLIEALPEIKCAREIYNDSKARCLIYKSKSFPTLSAWNYASIGGALEYLRSKWKGRLADVVPPDRISYGARFSRIPCIQPFGVDFWSQRDIFLIRPVPRRIQKPRIPNYLLSLPEETILISGRGQLQEGNLFGRVELASFGASSCVVTGDAIPLIPRPEYSYLLYAFFSTRLGLQLLRTCAIGTSIPAMHLGLLADLPIPDINGKVLSRITGHLKHAVQARVAATTAENEAIRIIEEEVLPEWLA